MEWRQRWIDVIIRHSKVEVENRWIYHTGSPTGGLGEKMHFQYFWMSIDRFDKPHFSWFHTQVNCSPILLLMSKDLYCKSPDVFNLLFVSHCLIMFVLLPVLGKHFMHLLSRGWQRSMWVLCASHWGWVERRATASLWQGLCVCVCLCVRSKSVFSVFRVWSRVCQQPPPFLLCTLLFIWQLCETSKWGVRRDECGQSGAVF